MSRLGLELNPAELLETVAKQIPAAVRNHVVVIGSIASAWAFRDLSETGTVATKDIDLLLRPSIHAVATAEALGKSLLDAGWKPKFMAGSQAGNSDTPEEKLPALRLTPPGLAEGWFVELLAEPPPSQTQSRQWRRLKTPQGDFGLPSFRYMPVATHGAEPTPFGIAVARPASMALAHLLEHAQPDRNPISTQPGYQRFQKDLGRAVSLWWLAQEQSARAEVAWLSAWYAALEAIFPGQRLAMLSQAQAGLQALDGNLREAHRLSMIGVLAPHGTTFEAFQRAHQNLARLLEQAISGANY